MNSSNATLQEQLTASAERLFTTYSELVVPYWEFGDHYSERLHLVHDLPAHTIEPDDHEPVNIPTLLSPWTITKNGMYFVMQRGHAEELRAEPWSETRAKMEREWGRRITQDLYLPLDGRVRASVTARNAAGEENTRELADGSFRYGQWMDVFVDGAAQLTAYSPNSHGILRHESLPNGPRSGDDRLVALGEVAAHQREVELAHMNGLKRLGFKILRGELDQSHLEYQGAVNRSRPRLY